MSDRFNPAGSFIRNVNNYSPTANSTLDRTSLPGGNPTRGLANNHQRSGRDSELQKDKIRSGEDLLRSEHTKRARKDDDLKVDLYREERYIKFPVRLFAILLSAIIAYIGWHHYGATNKDNSSMLENLKFKPTKEMARPRERY